MTAPSRQLARAARQLADQQSARIAAMDSGSSFYATVSDVSAGASIEGQAVVKVSYRGTDTTAAGYPDSYTPVVGHRVLCLVTRDHQLAILHRSIGSPPLS